MIEPETKAAEQFADEQSEEMPSEAAYSEAA